MKYRCYIFFLVFTVNFIHGQIQDTSSLKLAYKEYFELPREDVYLHLNKTTYIKGEDIWFTGYVQDRKSSLPSNQTTILYVFLYDSSGNVLDKQELFVKNGTTHGQFKITKDYTVGIFYIKAYTNWMRNFNKENTFVQSIEITDEISLSNEYDAINNKYKIELFPEGGNFVVNATTNFGFNVKNQNDEPYKIISGKIEDDNGGTILKNITNNTFGIGNFRFIPIENTSYRLIVILENGEIITKELPKPNEIGLNTSINNLCPNKLIISINTNERSLHTIGNREFYVVVHKDGQLALSSFLMNSTEVNLQISKTDLLPGINILTLFNDNFEPVSERVFFNENNFTDKIREIESITTTQRIDSLQLQLILNSKLNSRANLSISILPLVTDSNNAHKSILSSFLFDSYLNEPVRNINYYLSDTDRIKYFELDLLLINQGFSSNSWETIFNEPPERRFEHEKGINITGKVINAAYGETNRLALYRTSISPMQFTDISTGKNFEFNNVYIEMGTDLNFTLFNKKGKAIKPTIDANFSSLAIVDNGIDMTKNHKKYSETSAIKPLKNDQKYNYIINDDVTLLDEATVYATQKKEIPTQNTDLLIGMFEGVKISVENVKKHYSLSSFIKSLGFKIQNNPLENSFFILPKLNVPGIQPPVVLLNGMVTRENLTDFPLQSIDEIYYEHQGTRGSNGGTIYIYRKNGSFVGQKEVERFTQILADGGFSKSKMYSSPYYTNYSSAAFQKYGVVHWQSTIYTDNEGIAKFNIPDYGIKDLRVYIEGMDVKGKLISAVKDIHL